MFRKETLNSTTDTTNPPTATSKTNQIDQPASTPELAEKDYAKLSKSKDCEANININMSDRKSLSKPDGPSKADVKVSDIIGRFNNPNIGDFLSSWYDQ